MASLKDVGIKKFSNFFPDKKEAHELLRKICQIGETNIRTRKKSSMSKLNGEDLLKAAHAAVKKIKNYQQFLESNIFKNV